MKKAIKKAVKKAMKLTSLIIFVLFLLSGCSESQYIEIIIPAGASGFYYSEAEISPKKDILKLSSGAGLPSSVSAELKPVEVQEENSYEPFELVRDEEIKIDVEKGAWFKIGVYMENPSEANLAVSVKVENADARIVQEIIN